MGLHGYGIRYFIMSSSEDRQFYIYGIHPVIEALRSGRKIDRILVRKGLEGERIRELGEMARERSVAVSAVPVQKLDSITRGAHQGVIAMIARIEYLPFEEMVEGALSRKAAPLFLMLDSISDIRNLGAIARSAECAGADGIIIPEKGAAAINSDALKASAGALLRLPVSRVANLRGALYYFRDSDFQIVAASEKAEDAMYEVNFRRPTVIVLGSEGGGISPQVLSLCTAGARIPMAGETGSLNVGIAAAVILFEAVRQRNSQK